MAKKLKHLREKVKESTGKLKDVCWKGYTAVGTKMKNGREVPNCVPVKEEHINERSPDKYEMKHFKQKVSEAYGPLVRGASPRSTESRQAPSQQKSQEKSSSTSWKPTKTPTVDKSGAVHSPMSRARHLARLAMAKQIAKQKNEQFIVPTGFSESECSCEKEGRSSCKMHGEQYGMYGMGEGWYKIDNFGMKESVDPSRQSYKIRAARQHYAQTYMKHAKTIQQVKDAKEKAYASVKAKYGDKVHDELKAYHDQNMKESVEQVEEATHIIHTVSNSGKLGPKIKVSAIDDKNAEWQSKKIVGEKPYRGYKVHKVTKINEEDQLEEMAISRVKNSKGQKIEWHKIGDKHMIHVDGKQAHEGFLTNDRAAEMYKRLREEAEQIDEDTPAWQRKEGKSEAGGLNRKGIASYRRENPGSKLSMAVTTKPSKLKPGSKAANRRKSFCARMGGMKKRLTSAETARDPDSRINKALRKWNC